MPFSPWVDRLKLVVGLTEGLGCGKCKRVHERVASILPFSVAEKIADKPLRIQGLAMTTGLSRNFNLYTPEELSAFAEKLKDAPVYLEHVSVNDAVGKVTKTEWDGQNLLYTAEIYDEETAQKIRKGLIRHVSVGADYETLDVTSGGKIPHGLHNAEMSLVAVPGIPETNIQVLERLAESLAKDKRLHLSAKMREILEPLNAEVLQCVFCGKPGEYIVSVCTDCGDNAQSLVLPALEHLPVRQLHLSVRETADDLPTLFSAFKVRFVASPGACEKCMALDGKEFIYGQEPGLPHDGCKCPGYKLVERLVVHVNRLGVESLEETELETIAEKLAAKMKLKEAVMLKCPKCSQEFDAAQWEANGWKCLNAECGVEVAPPEPTVLRSRGEQSTTEKLTAVEVELTEKKAKLTEAEGKLTTTEGKLTEANNTVEKLKQFVPGVNLLKNPPKLMPVSEAVKMVKEALPAPMIQRSWGLGPQRMCQDLQRIIQKLETIAGGK